MIKYEIAVLERMMDHYTTNIEMFQRLQGQGHSLANDIADMVAQAGAMEMYFLMEW